MRLLRRKVDGTLCVSGELPVENLPEYAVLSHTWLGGHEEVTYEDILFGHESSKPASLAKLQFCEAQAAKDGLQHFWVDTCCINKINSGEVQEAISSMFEWYTKAARCYAYLADVKAEDEDWEEQFRYSRWFRRGWTLQELLAPKSVQFFSSDQRPLGDKFSLQELIHDITGISRKALCSRNLADFSIEEKMGWVSDRSTTHPEDKAYCLLGIFDVSLPVLYGEGDHAWTRLKKALDRKYGDDAEMNQILRALPIASDASLKISIESSKPIRFRDTRSRLLDEISQWIEGYDQRSTFWLTGPIGIGKSTIARTIARLYDEKGMLGGSFCFSKGSEDSRGASRFVTTLATQLASRPVLRKHILEVTATEVDIVDQSLKDQWEHLIAQPFSKAYASGTYTTIVLVVDALDECESDGDIQNLVDILGTIHRLRDVRLRILVTSSPELHDRHAHSITSHVGLQSFVSNRMKSNPADRDLHLFTKETLHSAGAEYGFDDDWPDDQSIAELVSMSGGLFLWVSLACRFILRENKHARNRLSSLIDQTQPISALPGKELDLMYSTILESSVRPDQGGDQETDRYAFSRLVYGSTVLLHAPLSMRALAAVLGISFFGVEDKLSDLECIFDIEYGLHGFVQLSHPSFRDFIIDDQRCTNANFWIDEKETHKVLWAGCISLMSRQLKKNICQLDYSATLSGDIDAEEVGRCIDPELQYACRYWASHFLQSHFEPRDQDEVHQFLEKHILNWIEVMGLIGSGRQVDHVLRQYQNCTSSTLQPEQARSVADVRRLNFLAQPTIVDSPLQIHITAEKLMPSLFKKKYLKFQRFQTQTTSAPAAARAPILPTNPVPIRTVAFTQDNTYVVSLNGHLSVRIWDLASQAEEWMLDASYVTPISCAAISSDGILAAVGSETGAVVVWDLGNRVVRHAFRSHLDCATSVQFSTDSSVLASTSSNGTMILWDMKTSRQIRKYNTRSDSKDSILAFYDNTSFATGSSDSSIRLWDVSHYSAQSLLILSGHTGSVNAAAFSPDGKRLISGSDDTTIRLWDMDAEETYAILRGHTGNVTAVKFSRGTSLVVSGSEDMTVRVWDPSNATLMHTLPGHTTTISAIMFSPSGLVLASQSNDDELRVWDRNTWKMLSATGKSVDERPDHV